MNLAINAITNVHLFKGTYTKTVYDLAGDLTSYSENIYKTIFMGGVQFVNIFILGFELENCFR